MPEQRYLDALVRGYGFRAHQPYRVTPGAAPWARGDSVAVCSTRRTSEPRRRGQGTRLSLEEFPVGEFDARTRAREG
jgi:hypothetical protein